MPASTTEKSPLKPATPAKPIKDAALELAALRAINYDWTMHLRSVWADPAYDSPLIHGKLRTEFAERLEELRQQDNDNSPLGWLLVGSAGSGKTHWLSVCRQQAVERQVGFVLIDMTDVRDFWGTVLQGFLDSLQQEYAPGKYQQQALLEKFLNLLKLNVSVERALELIPDFTREKLAENVAAIVRVIRKRHPQEAAMHQDVIRALLATSSNDPAINSAGYSWLSANPVDEEIRLLLGFTRSQQEPIRIVKALSWLMSLCGPTVLAFDQLDPIVAQLDPAAKADALEPDAEGLRALAIIQDIATGLSAMFDQTYRTLTLVSCLESTLEALRRYSIRSWQDRYETARSLPALTNVEAAAGLLLPRVAAGCKKAGFTPPYPTWPVTAAALKQVQGQSPRELLKLCEAHRRSCLSAGSVTELTAIGKEIARPAAVVMPVDNELDELFAKFRQAADVQHILEQSTEDERIAPLLISGCRSLLRELDLPNHLDAVVDDFPGGKTTKPLYARIRLIDHSAADREEHFSFRALERRNANAFQARIKGAINGSGIDLRLPFRHCIILRTQELPSGEITQKLVTQFNSQGGRWHKTLEDEVRTLHALCEMANSNPPGLEDWLKNRRPASRLPLFRTIVERVARVNAPPTTAPVAPPPAAVAPVAIAPATPTSTPVATPAATPAAEPPSPPATVVSVKSATPSTTTIPVGNRQVGSKSEQVELPLTLLKKHTVVLAGAGSGKTVLLKRLIEEAALCGIPSIVIDGANDLSSLSDRWPETPASWGPGDAAKAEAFHANTDFVFWTPGKESGNSLVFEPLPDLAAVANDAEELQQAVDAAVDALGSLVLTTKGAGAENKRGILSKALRFHAKQGGGDLQSFIALLNELPAEAGLGISKESKLAKEMADSLRAKIEVSPLLRGSGTGLDPAILFGDAKKQKPGPRISIISLIGLASIELRQQFVYQLGMTLFSWIKKNPQAPGRAMRGLLIVDEAKDFVPSQKSVASKISLQLLASQARKYGLGLVLATQTPKEIENKIIGNCSTHFYGKASSPAAVQTIQTQIQQCGGQGNDVPTLKAGQFYFYNAEAGLSQPVKLQTSLCLSRHQTLDEAQIMERAAKSREELAAG